MAVLWPSVLILCAEEPASDAASSQKVVSSTSEAATPGINSAVRTAQQEVRDPFAMVPLPPVAETPKPAPDASPKLALKMIKVDALQGIGFGSKDAYAVIGGEIFYVGDTKNGIKLLEVRRGEVDINVNGGKVTLSLFPGEDLQKARDRAKKKSAM